MVVDVIFDSLCRCFGGPEPGSSSFSADKRGDAKKRAVNFDAHAVAQSKLAGRSKKRKHHQQLKDDIFRLRTQAEHDKASSSAAASSPSPFPRFPSMAHALCFATPVRDDEEDEDIVRMESDCATLNTCEDTITSTVAFERKYAHIVESRPPMPLYHSFKVNVDAKETDELRRIVATDSHNSLKMIHYQEEEKDPVPLEESDEEEEEEDVVEDDDDVPPAVKIDSSSSSASSH